MPFARSGLLSLRVVSGRARAVRGVADRSEFFGPAGMRRVGAGAYPASAGSPTPSRACVAITAERYRRISMSGKRAIGVDVGGTKIVVGLVERDGTIARLARRPTPVGSQDAFLSGLTDAVDAVRD